MEPPMGQPMSKSDEELEIQALRRVISAYLKYVCQFPPNFVFLEFVSYDYRNEPRWEAIFLFLWRRLRGSFKLLIDLILCEVEEEIKIKKLEI